MRNLQRHTKLAIFLMLAFSGLDLDSSFAQVSFPHRLLRGPSIAPFTWTGNGGNANWTTAANWAGGVVPGASDTARFTSACASNCAATINASISVRGILIESSYTGTITQATGVTITIGSDGYSQAAGTFQGGNSSITINFGPFSLTGGVFVSTSGTLTAAGNWSVAGGTYTHNSGTVRLNDAGHRTANGGSATYFNLTLETGTSAGDSYNLQGSTFIVANTLTIGANASCCGGELSNGTLDVKGNVVLTGSRRSGNYTVRLSGTANQLVSGSGAGSGLNGLTIVKPSGTATLSGEFNVSGSFTYTSGSVDAAGSTIEFPQTLSITPGPIDFNNVIFTGGPGNVNFGGGTMKVLGLLTLNTSAGCCGGGFHNGTIEAYGNITVLNYGRGGTAQLRISGSASVQTMTITGTLASIPNLTIAKSAGNFAVTGTTRVGSLTYNSGSVDFSGSTLMFESDSTINSGSAILGNVILDQMVTQDLAGSTAIVGGDLTLRRPDSCCSGAVNNGTLEVRGNLIVGTNGRPGTANIRLAGIASSSVNFTAGAAFPTGNLSLAKTGGAIVTLATNFAVPSTPIVVTSGNLNMAGFNLSVSSLALNSNTITKAGGTLTVGGTPAGTGSLFGGTVDP